MRTLPALMLTALVMTACDDGSTTEPPIDLPDGAVDAAADAAPPPPAFCEGETAQLYDPFGSTEVHVWPDDLLTDVDPESPTGLRLSPGKAAWLEQMPSLIRDSIADLESASGFAHTGAVVLRFSGPVQAPDGDVEGTLTRPGLMFFDLDAEPPTRVPYDLETADDDATLILRPARPLRGGARHGVVLTADISAADGGCIAPSPTLRALLTGTDDAALAATVPAYGDLLAAADVAPEQVGAATVFTTHRDTAVLEAIAADLDRFPARWVERASCRETDGHRLCNATVELWDFRADRAVAGTTGMATVAVPITIWLPGGALPRATVLMGHGLSDGRWQAGGFFDEYAGDGVAVVAMDAQGHGSHPTRMADDFAAIAMDFLGLDLAGLRVDARRLTGNFDQTVLDRLQLLDLLRRSPDVDGDGVDDIEPDRLGYLGISLGGMMGAALLALDPTLELAILQVPGAHLTRFATSSAPVADFRPLIINLFGSEDRFARLLPILQTAVDRSDPATWAAKAMNRPGGPPHVLIQVSTFDEIAPPPTGVALARAFDVPHVGEVVAPVPLLSTGDAPARLNLPGGAASGGFTQFDRVGADVSLRRSGHNNLPWARQAQHQIRAFIEPWLDGEAPVVVDAYGELGVPPLAP